MDNNINQIFENNSLFKFFFDAPVYLTEKKNVSTQTYEHALLIQTKGNNNKKIVFLVQYDEQEFFPQSHLEIFNKILSALQLSMDDILIVNIRKDKDSVIDVINHISSKKIISMGVPCNGNTVLQTLSLTEIITSEENKKQFWISLKKHLA